MANAKPADVYRVLSLIKDVLVAKNNFIEFTGLRGPKTPNDVFQMMRQISMHHHEIAKKKNRKRNSQSIFVAPTPRVGATYVIAIVRFFFR